MTTRTIEPSATTTRPDDAAVSSATIRRGLVATGLAGIAAIHLADLPDKMAEVPYLGWAYVGLIVASLVLAELVTTRSDRRLMAASGGLAAAVLVGFVVNRTVGMPQAMDDIGNWTEPLGMISLLVEAAVVWVAARAWFARD
jgi:hypothetical protein